MAGTTKVSEHVRIVISDDRMRAGIQTVGLGEPGFVCPTTDEIISGLESAKVAVDDSVRAKVEQFAKLVRAVVEAPKGTEPPKLPDEFVVLEGTPAVNAVDGSIEWSESLAKFFERRDHDDRIDWFTLNSIATVTADTHLGRIVPPTPGKPAVDVYGNEIPPRKPRGSQIQVGYGIDRSDEEEEGRITATSDGRVLYENGKIRILEILDIPGNVDFESGNIDSCVDVTVRGSVLSGFSARTKKSLHVDRVIEGARVEVDENIVVRGGIFGNDQQGRITAGGSITAQLINEAIVRAGGDVYFNKEVLTSKVYAVGKVVGNRGTVIGGEIYGREGIEVRVIGSDANVATKIAVGRDINELRRARQKERQIKEQEKSAEQIREAVQPLLANLKRLLPAQREKATELMCKADEIDTQMDEMREEAERIIEGCSPKDQPYILVEEIIHPGTHLVVDGHEIVVQKPIHGPAKLEMRKLKGSTQLVAVNQRTGSVVSLPSVEVDLDVPPTEDEPEQGGQDDGSEQQSDGNAGA